MKIAFVGAPSLFYTLGDKICYYRPEEIIEIANQDFDGVIIQLDITSTSDDTFGPNLGWNLLQRLIGSNDDYQIKPIIITGWRDSLVQKSRANFNFGYVESTSILFSPLIKFIPLRKLFQERKNLISFFETPLPETQSGILLKKDLKHNLYSSSVIHEYLHDFKEKVRSETSFNKLKLAEELIREMVQFLRYNLGTSFSSNAESLLNTLSWTLMKSEDKLDFIYHLGKFEDVLEDILTNHEELPPGFSDITIVCIDDRKAHFNLLQEVLRPFQITCIYAADYSMAQEILIAERGEIAAVLCDFRFYDSEGRFSRVQGYHILEQLRLEFPQIKYAFLSDRIGLTHALPEELRWVWPEFKKREIIDIRNTDDIYSRSTGIEQLRIGLPALLTFLDLAERERQQRQQKLPGYLEKKLKNWNYLQQIVWVKEREEDISQISWAAIQGFMKEGIFTTKGLGFYAQLPVGKSEGLKANYLLDRLVKRRIVLGFLQIPFERINQKLPALDLYLDEPSAKWALIYSVLKKGPISERDIEPVNLSKAFHELGFQKKKDYSFRNQLLKQEILPNEWDWLQTHGMELEMIDAKT